MCARFTAKYTCSEMHTLWNFSGELFPTAPSNMAPRYNIAPTQDLDFVANDTGGNLELRQGRGGLVPFWP